MKASIIKRIEALEQAAVQVARHPLILIDVTKFDSPDRSAYWDGDNTVLTRYGLQEEPVEAGTIHSIVIDLHPQARERWLETRDLDEGDLDAFEQQRTLDDRRRAKAGREQAERERLAAIAAAEPRAVIGWDREGNPVFDGDPGVSTNWGD